MLAHALDKLGPDDVLLLDRGYEEGSVAKPGDFVLERAFVET